MGHICTPGKQWEKEDILRDGKQPKNDLETTKAFSPRTTPIPILRKRKKKILILIRFAWRRDLRREKSLLFRERTKCRNPAPFGGHMASWAWAGCPALKEVLSIS